MTLGVLVLLGSPALAGAQDRVDRKNGPPLVGKVLSEDCKAVEIKPRRGKQRKVPADQVLDVVRANAPEAYLEGRASLHKGKLREAASKLQQAGIEGKAPWLKEYTAFYRGEALRSLGDYPAAIKAYGDVLRANSKSRFLARVRLATARCQAASGRSGDAIKTLDQLASEVSSRSLPESFGIEARLQLGRLRSAKGEHGQAATDFAAVVRAADRLLSQAKDPETRSNYQALVLQARRDLGAAYTRAGKYGQAESTYSQVRSKWRDDPIAAAIADIGRAEVTLAKGDADKARVQLSAARAKHFAVTSERPRVLWLLARAYQELDKKGERGAAAISRSYLRLLVEQDPDSDQAAEARKLLK